MIKRLRIVETIDKIILFAELMIILILITGLAYFFIMVGKDMLKEFFTWKIPAQMVQYGEKILKVLKVI